MDDDSSPARAAVAPRKAPPEIQVRVSWCKGCGLCVDYCNRDVLAMSAEVPVVVQAERCTRCMLCEAVCPDFAISVVDAGGSPAGEGRTP